MKSTTLKTLFFGLFLIATFAVKAQEEKTAPKYAFATLTQLVVGGTNANLCISIEGQNYETKKYKVKDAYDRIIFFEEVAKLQEQGWSVFNVNGGGIETTFFLRKRK